MFSPWPCSVRQSVSGRNATAIEGTGVTEAYYKHKDMVMSQVRARL